MRINLSTPFAEKDQVKALGAKWDAQKKCWYITDVEDLTPFARWMTNSPGLDMPIASNRDFGCTASAVNDSPPPPHCGCPVLPWESCIHTPPVPIGAKI